MARHLISLESIRKDEVIKLLKLAKRIKTRSAVYHQKLKGKKLLMLFAKPSLRTRLSFEIAMYELGGMAIFYDIANSPLGKKESVKDEAKVASKYVDAIIARLYSHDDMLELAKYAEVPVINGLDNYEHPCQVLSDLFTMKEKLKQLDGLTLTYLGDANNNVTNSLLYACPKMGINLIICCPKHKKFLPSEDVVDRADDFAKNSLIKIEYDPLKAVRKADVVYTDSWMSYHIPESQKEKRLKILKPYQVNKKLMKEARRGAIFMHCLPAKRGEEVTDEVIDGKQSVVFEQAFNRLVVEKAILIKLLK